MKSSNNKLSKQDKDSNSMILITICALAAFLLFRVLFIKEEGFQDLSNNEKSDADIVNELDSVCSILETQDQIKFE